MNLKLVICSLISFFLETALFADSVLLRGSDTPIECRVISGGLDGLHVELLSASATITSFPWSSVAQINTEIPRPALEKYLQQGDRLWRAKTRFLRGDLQLAEPSFALLFRELEGVKGEDARLVAEGLLRCYVSKGNLQYALHPWLETVRLEELGVPSPYTDLLPILDKSTFLCPHLPPLWETNAYSKQVLEEYKNSTLKATSSIASLLLALQNGDNLSQLEGVSDPAFLLHIVDSARGENNDDSSVAKQEETVSDWKQAWSNYFSAVGMLRKGKAESKQRALILLATVSAQSQRTVPWLSGSAMLMLADELKKDGFTEEADRIQQEMYRVFPTHPLLQSEVPN